MSPRILILLGIGMAAAGCDLGTNLEPLTSPDLLIGGSPLKPLADPLDVEIWSWESQKTGQTHHQVEVGVLVAEEQFADAEPSGAYLETTVVFSQDGRSVARPAASVDPLTDLSPEAAGDGYALVVIAVFLTSRESDALEAALAVGDVEVAVETSFTEQNDAGEWDMLDELTALLLADPRPSPLPIPPEFSF